MKLKKILMPLFALAIIVSVALVSYTTVTKEQTKIENAIEVAQSVKIEHKEAYKLDDAEYKGAVATKSDFSRSHAGGYLIGIVSLFTLISNFFTRKRAVGIGVVVVAIAGFVIGDLSYAVMATFPVIPFYRSPDGDEIMSGAEIQKLLKDAAKENGNAIAESVKKSVDEATKGLITSEVLTKRLEEIGIKDNVVKTLSDAVEKQGQEISKMISEGNKNKHKDIEELVREKGEEIKALGGSDTSKKFKMKINAEKTVVYSSSVTSSSLSYRENQIGQLAAPNVVFDKVFRTVNLSEADLAASNGVISYLDVTAETNNAAETAETNSQTVGSNNKPESAITWQEYTQALRVIADTIPVTRNSYRHLGFIAGEIDRLLKKNQAQRKDTQIYKGDGNAPNIKGIYTFTTAVTLASLPQYAQVIMPNLADLVMNLATYVANKSDASGAQSKYSPNVLFINPADALKFLIKNNLGTYQLPPFMANGKVGNLTIIESPKVVANTLMVGDASFGTIYQAEDVTIEMGLVNDQFLKNQWTIRAEQELCFLQRTADLGAFTKVTDINAAIAALTLV